MVDVYCEINTYCDIKKGKVRQFNNTWAFENWTGMLVKFRESYHSYCSLLWNEQRLGSWRIGVTQEIKP